MLKIVPGEKNTCEQATVKHSTGDNATDAEISLLSFPSEDLSAPGKYIEYLASKSTKPMITTYFLFYFVP